MIGVSGDSLQIYTVATIVASRSPNIQTLIAMRVISAMGSSAVVAVGAGCLAEVYDVHERGQKVCLITHRVRRLTLARSVLWHASSWFSSRPFDRRCARQCGYPLDGYGTKHQLIPSPSDGDHPFTFWLHLLAW